MLWGKEIERIKERAGAVPDYFGIAGSPLAWRNAYQVGRKDVPHLIAELERALTKLAASRALVAEIKPYVQHLPSPAGACRENFCYCGATDALALTEAEMRDRLEERRTG